MAEILPSAMSGWDEKKARMIRTVAQAMAHPIDSVARNWAQQADASNEFKRNMAEATPEEQIALANRNVQGGAADMVGGVGRVGGALAEAAQAARAQLAPYQQAVFDRIFAATLDPMVALQRTKTMTSLMSPPPPGIGP